MEDMLFVEEKIYSFIKKNPGQSSLKICRAVGTEYKIPLYEMLPVFVSLEEKGYIRVDTTTENHMTYYTK